MIEHLVQIYFSGDRLTNAIAYAPIGGIAGVLGVLIGVGISKLIKKDVALPVFIAAVVTSFQIPNLVIRPWLVENYPEAVLLHENRLIAQEINKSGPTRLDETTLLKRTEGTVRGLNYIYQLELSYSDIPDIGLLRNETDNYIVPAACNDKDVREFLDSGKVIQYTYYDSRDAFIFSVEVMAERCSG